MENISSRNKISAALSVCTLPHTYPSKTVKTSGALTNAAYNFRVKICCLQEQQWLLEGSIHVQRSDQVPCCSPIFNPICRLFHHPKNKTALSSLWSISQTRTNTRIDLPACGDLSCWACFPHACRHHQHGRWQARIGRVAGNKDLYLGTFSKFLFPYRWTHTVPSSKS